MNDSHIRSISMPSKEYGLIQSGILQVHSDTSEYDDGFVYWSENGKEKTDIFKSMVDGSAHQYDQIAPVVLTSCLPFAPIPPPITRT